MKTSKTSNESKTSGQGRSRRAKSSEMTFPALRGVQAGREYFITGCPLHLVSTILAFEDPGLSPEHRAQRVLNAARVPQITRYLVSNPETYVMSALTASIDADVRFVPMRGATSWAAAGVLPGRLTMPAGARIVVNDGQHRRAAIAEALKERPELAHESVPIVLFLDAGLRRNQQIFADLNRHALRPTRSLGVLYDHRDSLALVARRVAEEVSPFAGLTEMEKSSISNRSSKVFTLSGLYQASDAFLRPRRGDSLTAEEVNRTLEFWAIVGDLICGWGFLGDGRTAADLRRDFIHTHAVALHALGNAGHDLVIEHPTSWPKLLRRLEGLDWSRARSDLWERRALQNGRVSKAGPSLILTTNVIKARLGLSLTGTEWALEETLPKENRVAA